MNEYEEMDQAMMESSSNESAYEAENEPEWITKKDEIEGDFEYELFLSSDGKNTVHVKANTNKGREAANKYAKMVFERVMARYGTKAEQYIKTNGLQTGSKVAPNCGIHGNPMAWKEGESKTTGKHYAFWACPTKNADGSFCNFSASKR